MDLSAYAKLTDIPPDQFISTTSMTVANLLANYPANAARVGKYARVTDLWGVTDEIMRCSSDGATYFWRPQRVDYATYNTSTSGAMTLTPLVTPPVLYLAGTLLGSMTVTPSTTNAWPGAQFEVISTGALGIFGISINGLIGGGSLPLLQGGRKLLTYTTSGWRGG